MIRKEYRLFEGYDLNILGLSPSSNQLAESSSFTFQLRTRVRAFPDGVYFVSLAPVLSRDLLIGAIAGALGVRFSGPESPREQLFNALSRRTMLLVLDNFHLRA